MEADISIWRKTGHFYFALTANAPSKSTPILRLHVSRRVNVAHLFRGEALRPNRVFGSTVIQTLRKFKSFGSEDPSYMCARPFPS